MPKKAKQTFQKREKERARAAKQQEKEIRRLESKKLKENTSTTDLDDVDPDIAGILPGPQPLPEQWHHDSNVISDAGLKP